MCMQDVMVKPATGYTAQRGDAVGTLPSQLAEPRRS